MRSVPDACYLPFLPFTYVPFELKFDKNLNKISKIFWNTRYYEKLARVVIISWYVINARAWWAHQWFDTLLYWKLIIQKYFSIFKIDKKVFQLKNKLTDMRAFFSYFTWSKKKVMQHYFWNWLTHNFCHTLERWGRYYRMGSFKIFAEAVRNFWNQNVINASLFHVQHN